MSPDQAQQRAERLVDAWSNQTYPGLRSLCHLIAAELLAVQRECAERVAELESALRLHLAIGPEDPLLLTPIEHQLADAQARVTKLEEENRSASLQFSRCELIFERVGIPHQGDTELSLRQFFKKYQELAQQHATLRERCERLEKANSLLMECSYQSHSGHWDRTGQSGAGCDECNRARRLREEAKALATGAENKGE